MVVRVCHGGGRLQAVLYEHQAWLASSVAAQLASSCDVATARWPDLATECAAQLPPPGQLAEAGGGTAVPGGAEGSLAALEGFDLKAAALLLDEEMRSAVRGGGTVTSSASCCRSCGWGPVGGSGAGEFCRVWCGGRFCRSAHGHSAVHSGGPAGPGAMYSWRVSDGGRVMSPDLVSY